MDIQEKEPRSGWEAFAWQVLRRHFPTKFMGKLAIIYAAIIIIYGIKYTSDEGATSTGVVTAARVGRRLYKGKGLKGESPT